MVVDLADIAFGCGDLDIAYSACCFNRKITMQYKFSFYSILVNKDGNRDWFDLVNGIVLGGIDKRVSVLNIVNCFEKKFVNQKRILNLVIIQKVKAFTIS